MTAVSYEPVIGLEVHAQLLTRTKLFCACLTSAGAPPNTHVCAVCLGLPGALPVPNGGAIEMAIKAGLALGCDVRGASVFARKNYFYPDLAKGYQISQYDLPINAGGSLEIDADGARIRIGVTRIHLEEDAAKNLHGVGEESLVDFNRAGVPLIEIVSEPDLRSAGQAEAYLRKLREILMFLGVNDGNLEEGSFRCDANVSIRPVGTVPFGTRVELKNINSFRFVRKAIEHEIGRQEGVLAAGGTLTQETRTWSESSDKTLPMRSKEDAHDYRYFADPDLPVLAVREQQVADLAQAMPELPEARRHRWQANLGLTPYDAGVLTGHPAFADYFESAVRSVVERWGPERAREAGKKVANVIQAEILRYATTNGLAASLPVPADHVGELVMLIDNGTLSSKMAKDVLGQMVKTGKHPQSIVESTGLLQLTDASAIDTEVKRVLEKHPEAVEKYRSGKANIIGFLVGQVMLATGGKAKPETVQQALREALGPPQ